MDLSLYHQTLPCRQRKDLDVRHRADYVPAKRLALDIQPDFLPGIGIEAVPAQNVCAAGSDVEEALFVHDIF